MLRRTGPILFASLFLLVENSEGQGSVLKSVTYSSAEAYTRVVLTLSDVSRYKTGFLKERRDKGLPGRIYVDLRETTVGKAGGPVRVGDGRVARIRAGQFNKSVARVVIDLQSVTSHKSFVLSDPFRIIIEVNGTPEERNEGGNRQEDSTGRPDLRSRRMVVVIDPGHGGKDTGAIGWKGLREKDVVLDLAKRLASLLEKEDDVKVAMTRTDDLFVSLEDRTAFANANNADLFISLHTNASTSRRAHGIETYYLDNTTDEAALRLAARENNMPKQQVESLQFILSDLTQTHKLADSISLAKHMQISLIRAVKLDHREVRDLGVKKALFYVLVGAEMPSVLVEASFITNPREGRRLVDPRYLDRVAKGLRDGIGRYLSTSHRAKTL